MSNRCTVRQYPGLGHYLRTQAQGSYAHLSYVKSPVVEVASRDPYAIAPYLAALYAKAFVKLPDMARFAFLAESSILHERLKGKLEICTTVCVSSCS